jgi:metallo-beta-lactamase class B
MQYVDAALEELDVSKRPISVVVKNRPDTVIASVRAKVKNYADILRFEQELIGDLRGVLWHRCADSGSLEGEPFVALKYVGANLISSFLIVTPAGNILLDTGPSQMLPQVAANIEKLGFNLQDVKVLLNSHAHDDHCGAFAEIKRRTGATLITSKLDGDLMMGGGKGDFYWGDDAKYEPVTPDRIVSDDERVEIGGVSLTTHLTPGHTKGCTSWSMSVHEDGRNYNVLFLCGLTVSPYKLTNNDQYPNIAEDERSTLQRLGGIHADVLLAPHGFYFDLEGKAARQKAGAPNSFVDPDELGRHVSEMKRDFEEALQAQEKQR